MLRQSILALSALLAIPVAAELQPMPVTLPPQPAAASDDETVSYESGPARYLDKQKMWQMTGGVKFTQSDAHLDTNAALVNLDKDLKAKSAKSLAPVHIYDTLNDLTGDHGFLDFTSHVATLNDHITLIARPRTNAKAGSPQSQIKDPATLTCEVMTYDYRKKMGTVPGPLVVHQKDRILTANSGIYNGKDKTVTLVGNVHAKQGDGNEIFAQKMTVGIEEGNEWIYIPGPIRGAFKSQKDDKPAPTKPAEPAPGAPPPDLPLPDGALDGTAPTIPAPPVNTPADGQPATINPPAVTNAPADDKGKR